jgi:hypothetical protein
MRAHFEALKCDRKSGARRRAMQFAFQCVNEALFYPWGNKNPSHADAERAAPNDQKCKHYKHDPAALWQPVNSHAHRQCQRQDEPVNGSKYKTICTLPMEEGLVVEAHKLFWRNTFGLSKNATPKPRKFRDFTLPADAHIWGGRRACDKTRLVEACTSSVSHRYSHFSMTPTHEFIDCAPSALNCWQGPTEINDGGSVSPSFLGWLDERNENTHHDFYKQHNWFPGVHDTRNNKPQGQCGSEAKDFPALGVSYALFKRVVSRHNCVLKTGPWTSTEFVIKHGLQYTAPLRQTARSWKASGNSTRHAPTRGASTGNF